MSKVLQLLLSVFYIVCLWRTFVKAGEPGWKSIIPFYNFVVLYKVARVSSKLFWTNIVLLFVSSLFSGIIGLLVLIPVACFSLSLVINMAYCHIKLFERFGLKSALWTVCAIFVPIVGCAVIAFNEYMEYDFE